MKFLMILGAILAFATCDFMDDATKRMMKTMEECTKSAGATEEDVMELAEIKIPSRKEAKCVLACYHKKFGIQDKDGKLDKAGAIEAMKDLKAADAEMYDKAVEIFDTCIEQVPNQDCECETAAIFMYCFNMYGKMMGLKHGMVPM